MAKDKILVKARSARNAWGHIVWVLETMQIGMVYRMVYGDEEYLVMYEKDGHRSVSMQGIDLRILAASYVGSGGAMRFQYGLIKRGSLLGVLPCDYPLYVGWKYVSPMLGRLIKNYDRG